MDLYIARHGEAGKSLSSARKDVERSLTVEGRKQAEDIAGFFERLGVRFDAVATSPLPRAKETADRAVALQKKLKLQVWEELMPEGEKDAMLAKLAKIGHGSSVLVVGHEPYLTALVSELIGCTPGTLVLKKGGLIRLQITTFSPAAKGELRWLLSPRVIRRISQRE